MKQRNILLQKIFCSNNLDVQQRVSIAQQYTFPVEIESGYCMNSLDLKEKQLQPRM